MVTMVARYVNNNLFVVNFRVFYNGPQLLAFKLSF